MTADPFNIFNVRADRAADHMSVAVKANIAVKDWPHTGGIKAYSEAAAVDALVVNRLRAAGYNICGLANMEEGALGAQTDNPWFGKTHNPLKMGYTPGGSSGGSAAAAAADMCRFSLGTDTMGSVRIPSAYCGLWGFKPSHDAAMLAGVMPLSPTLDTVGVHAKSLKDIIGLTEVICARDFSGGRAGQIVSLDYAGKVELQPDVAAAYTEFLQSLPTLPHTGLGPYDYSRSRRAGLILSEVEGYAFHAPMLEQNPDGFSKGFRQMLEYGRDLDLDKIDAAYAHVKALRAADYPEFILMPTAPQTAFKFGTPVPANQADFTAFANLADRPAIQFPIGKNAQGLPIGAQLVGPRGREADLIASLKTLLAGRL